MEPRLTRGQKRKQEASATAATASAEDAGPSSGARPCLRNTRSRKAADEATNEALKAPAVSTRSSKTAQPSTVPSKRPAERPATRARSKRPATNRKQAEAPVVKQEEDLPGTSAVPAPSVEEAAGPSTQDPQPSGTAGPSTRMEEDRRKSPDQKRSDAAAAAQREADDQVHARASHFVATAVGYISKCTLVRAFMRCFLTLHVSWSQDKLSSEIFGRHGGAAGRYASYHHAHRVALCKQHFQTYSTDLMVLDLDMPMTAACACLRRSKLTWFFCSALQGLLRKLGAGFDDMIPQMGLSSTRMKV